MRDGAALRAAVKSRFSAPGLGSGHSLSSLEPNIKRSGCLPNRKLSAPDDASALISPPMPATDLKSGVPWSGSVQKEQPPLSERGHPRKVSSSQMSPSGKQGCCLTMRAPFAANLFTSLELRLTVSVSVLSLNPLVRSSWIAHSGSPDTTNSYMAARPLGSSVVVPPPRPKPKRAAGPQNTVCLDLNECAMDIASLAVAGDPLKYFPGTVTPAMRTASSEAAEMFSAALGSFLSWSMVTYRMSAVGSTSHMAPAM